MTAWAAAYALVLQLVLPGVLLAASHAYGAGDGYRLCLGADAGAGVSGQAQPGAGDGAPAAHCPLCLFRTDAIALPPPAPRLLEERVAHSVLYEVLPPAAVREGRLIRAYRSRAPPSAA